MTDKENKGQLRKLALSNRNALDAQYRHQASKAVAEKLLELPLVKKADVVMIYRSFRSELETGEIVENLRAQGKKLCFPLCEKAGIMQAYSPVDENSWKKGYMGIIEPEPEKSEHIAPEDIDLVVCPMVAFDSNKNRMGYGGGYYDRYLPACTKALRIGLAFELQRVDALIPDEYDQKMDIIITEKDCIL